MRASWGLRERGEARGENGLDMRVEESGHWHGGLFLPSFFFSVSFRFMLCHAMLCDTICFDNDECDTHKELRRHSNGVSEQRLG